MSDKYSLMSNIILATHNTKWTLRFGLWFTSESTTDSCIISYLSSSSVYLYNLLLSALRCNEECAVGTYGQDCKGVCDCANGARCYNIDGGCLCEPGFSGPQCRDRMCAHGKYGMHCERTCLCQDKHTLRWVGVWRRFKLWKYLSEAVSANLGAEFNHLIGRVN